MHFSGGINRPPYETADGYLQITEGCSHNTCLFCTYFKDQRFRKSTIEEIEADIREIPATCCVIHQVLALSLTVTLFVSIRTAYSRNFSAAGEMCRAFGVTIP